MLHNDTLLLSIPINQSVTGTAAAMKICCALFVHFPCKNNDIVGVSSLFMDSTPLLDDTGMLILSNSLVNQTVWSSNNLEMLLFLVHFL